MADQSSSPIQGCSSLKVDDDELPPVMQSTEQQVDLDSSSDDIPLRTRRPARAYSNDRESSYDLRDRRQLRDHMRNINDTSLLDQRRTAHQATIRKSPKATAKSAGKTPKKPGPRPWASKPIKKNDMVAKKQVIREIESYWGKGFIKSYIPKCHRPLIKRGKCGKRAMYRDHETDPKKWLPSVLKSILSLAKLTQSKEWIKKAMDDVVRYRIKNTGNRKPQLVTTDFDVLEDMLIKDWDVPYSFSIRYKHLLVNRLGPQETDADIDHILGVGTGAEDRNDDEDGSEEADVTDGDNHDRDEDGEDDEDDSEEETTQGGLTGQYLHASGYISAPQYQPPHPLPGLPVQKQKIKMEEGSKRGADVPPRPQPPISKKKDRQASNHPYPYGPPMDPWGRPMSYSAGPDGFGGFGGYGPYGLYGGYGGYGPPPDSSGRQPSQPPGYYGMGHYPPHHPMTPAPSQANTDRTGRKRSRAPSTGGNKRMRTDFEQSPSHSGHPGFRSYGYGHPPNFHGGHPQVKQEFPEAEMHGEKREASADEDEDPVDEIGEDSNAAAVEAELRATELELKVARLQARRAALNQQSKTK